MKTRNSIYLPIFTYVIFVTVIFYGCSPEPQGGSVKRQFGNYVIKVIDSCEYIEYDAGFIQSRVYTLTHKGNCKFCSERIKKLK